MAGARKTVKARKDSYHSLPFVSYQLIALHGIGIMYRSALFQMILQNSIISFFLCSTASLYSTEHKPRLPQHLISICP